MKRTQFFAICLSLCAGSARSLHAQVAHSSPAHGLFARSVHPPQTTIPGFALDPVQRPIGVFDAYATLSDHTRVVFDGLHVDHVDEAGNLIAQLGSTPQSTFPSFVLADPTETYALVAESSNGAIFKVDLGGAGLTLLADVNFNFDAVFEDATHVLLSAATCGFNCGNDILRLNAQSGALTTIGHVSGPSGPLAVATNGDVYYCLQPASLTALGAHKILHWTSAQVAAGGLSVANASVFASGLKGGSSLRCEAVYGHVFVTQTPFDGEGELLEFDAQGELFAHVIKSSGWLSNIEFLYGPGPGSFQAFQPANGVTLHLRATDFDAFSAQIESVDPVRPTASIAGAGLNGPGPVTITIERGPPHGSATIMTTRIADYDPFETSYDTGMCLLHTGMHLDMASTFARGIALDAQGNALFTYDNPGTQQGTSVFQAWTMDAAGVFVGSSNAVFN